MSRVIAGDTVRDWEMEPAGKAQYGVDAPHCKLLTFRVDADVEVETGARRRFESSSYVELREVRCEVRQGVLKLTGRVSSFYLKQVAITIARQIDGVLQVRDELKVPFAADSRLSPRNRSWTL